MNKLTPNAGNLRKNMTSQERKLWNIIKNKQFYGYNFLRQYVIEEYIADFVCREKKIIIEIDNGQHNQNNNIEYDKKRTVFFEKLGYKVVRFWNNEIDDNIEGVYNKLQEIFKIEKQHLPQPSLVRKRDDKSTLSLTLLRDKNLYYIGGVVRDEVLGLSSFDIDLTYNGNAIEFAKTIPETEIIQINESFGTVKIKLNSPHLTSHFGEEQKSIEIDIASTRSETYPQKGHLPVVNKIGCSLKEDILRRDFTINAMAKSTLTGEIIDYTGGFKDIKNKILRVLHDESFVDDPTRILRMLKFAVRFGFEPDEHTRKLQEEYLSNINYDMSYKRLKKELIETFNLNKWKSFEQFVNQKIYKLITPQKFELPEYNFSKLIEKFKPQYIWIIYVGLLPDISNLPLTKKEKQIVDEFNKIKNVKSDNDFTFYKTFKNIPLESVIMYSTINNKIAEKYLNELKDIDILINGNDLKNLGIEPSSKYQQCFDYILDKKIKNPDLTKDDELKLAKEFFDLI